MKIIAIVTHPSNIRLILSRIGWPTEAADFNSPDDIAYQEVSQLETPRSAFPIAS
ncbi:MAG: hypothetical protein LLG04_03185 [Parachlamydia sp.]|nr:hypothetical protein [Parachlamydia sp.]